MAAARTEAVRPREGQWISRSLGITGALVASFAVAGVIASSLMSGDSNSAKRVPVVLAIPKPIDLTKAVVQAPVLESPTTNSAISAPSADRAQTARDDAITSLIAKAPVVANPAGTTKDAVTQQGKPEIASRAPIAAPVTSNPPTRANRAAEETAARKLAEDKARAEREAADHIKSAIDPKAAVSDTPQQTPRGPEAAEEKAASDRAIAAQRAAEEKVASEKAAADRAKAAELATIQAQETGKLAQEQEAARQAKSAKDAADRVAKDAADRARAEKVAEEEAKAARQEANRVFSHSLFGFSR
jgi:hypothetical protein